MAENWLRYDQMVELALRGVRQQPFGSRCL